jgi:anti-anti-sigma factor
MGFTEIVGTPELVKGHETVLLARLMPLVRERYVRLDMRLVERIDAAGIAALLALYGAARNAGHRFELVNVPERVDEVLAVVGLETILVSHNAVQFSHDGDCLNLTAA